MKSLFACDSVSHEGATNTWFTPQTLIKSLGPFDLDPCTQSYRPFDTALTHICEDTGQCGLTSQWRGRVWLNPPYGRMISMWLDKAFEHNNVVALVFNRSETQWGQKAIASADAVNFIKGRISFVKADGNPVTNAGTGSMLIAYGMNNVKVIQTIPGVVFTRQQRSQS